MRDGRPFTEVAVGVLIRPDGAVLLGSRPEGKPFAGYWEFPGGKLEPGETPGEALEREMREELDLALGETTPWLVRTVSYPHALVRLHFRRCFSWSGEPRSMEGQEFGFFRWRELRKDRILPLVEQTLAWTRLPERAARIDLRQCPDQEREARIRRALASGARLLDFWLPQGETEPPAVPGAWSGSCESGALFRNPDPQEPVFRGGKAGSLEDWEGGDFLLLEGDGSPLEGAAAPLYLEQGRPGASQGVWQRF